MSERFSVRPEQLSRAGATVELESRYVDRITYLLGTEAVPKSDFVGLMGELREPIETLMTKTRDRYDQRQTTLHMTGDELRSLAKVYQENEDNNSRRFREGGAPGGHDQNRPGDPGMPMGPYVQNLPDLTAPEAKTADVKAIVEDTMSWLADVNGAIKDLIGWDAIEEGMKPLLGNWEELTRIGQVYGKSGTGIEAAGKEFSTTTVALKPTWDGQAASAFDDYAANLAGAMQGEGPLMRVLEKSMAKLAKQIEEMVRTACKTIQEKLKEEVDTSSVWAWLKLLAKKIPIVGWVLQGARIIQILWQVYEKVNEIIDQIEKTIALLKEIIAFAQNPEQYLQGAADAKIAELKKKMDDAQATAELGVDIASLPAAVPAIVKAPKDSYSGGFGADPWKDAQ
ncbi:hypothetical protein MSTE_00007 [Mycobacteroides stephanolepidis]|uniref:Uncharacterized protein n=1 Tax=[Mycobacterium] stephanolepidis TaxID=1520670 RepID=A0A1Z4EQX8_9MYCO|nr:WXG100 family type VII secretion target [[Mycobacterium] stephanolepidis]BAX95360.1 hypothetical protein MSTE_00007 [[Mycobacterium] stephanolepidis]